MEKFINKLSIRQEWKANNLLCNLQQLPEDGDEKYGVQMERFKTANLTKYVHT